MCSRFTAVKGQSFRNAMQHKAIFIFRITRFIMNEPDELQDEFHVKYRYNDTFAGRCFSFCVELTLLYFEAVISSSSSSLIPYFQISQ